MNDMPMQSLAPMGVPNPAFAQWAQQAQAWIAEKQRRDQQFQAACALIKSDAINRFKIDIEADSTIAADEQAEKQARIEFLTALTPFLETVLPQMQANPALAPLGKELVMFAVRGFRVSRSLEDAFETALDNLGKGAPPPPNQQGTAGGKTSMEIQATAATEAGKQRVQEQANAVKMMEVQTEAQTEAAKLAAERERDAVELAMKGREIEGREVLEQARIHHLAVRDASREIV